MFESLIFMNTFRNTAIGCMYQKNSLFKFQCSGLLPVLPRTKTGPCLGIFCIQQVMQWLISTVFTYTLYIKYGIFPPGCFGGRLPSSRSNTKRVYDLTPSEDSLHTHKEGVASISCSVIMCNKSHSCCIYHAVSKPCKHLVHDFYYRSL